MENIGLQDSLLSRFDLLFVLLDTVDVETDKKISDHVVRIHRYRSPNEVDGAVSTNVTGFQVGILVPYLLLWFKSFWGLIIVRNENIRFNFLGVMQVKPSTTQIFLGLYTISTKFPFI